jgi:hypothetical protein
LKTETGIAKRENSTVLLSMCGLPDRVSVFPNVLSNLINSMLF